MGTPVQGVTQEVNNAVPTTTVEQPSETAQTQVAGITVAPEHVEFYKKLEQKLRTEFEERLLIWKKTELADIEKETDDKVRDLVAEFWEKWKEEQKPPTPEQIAQLLSQEYVTYKIKVNIYDTQETREFVLRELPQSAERKFFRQFRENLQTYGPRLQAFAQANLGKNFDETLRAFMDAFDDAFDIIADTVMICLDPFGKHKDITREWVQDNIASSRQWNIIQAQIQANRLRDFFSQVYRAGQNAEMTMKPLSFQGLLERVR